MPAVILKDLDQKRVMAVVDELLTASKNTVPIAKLGDDDSIHLTPEQIGFKKGLQKAVTLIYTKLLEHQ